jgi:hypothetical protein
VAHFKEQHEDIKSKLFPCGKCNRIFTMLSFYNDHNCSGSNNIDAGQKSKETVLTTNFKCETCPDTCFDEEEQLLCHQIAIHENLGEKYAFFITFMQ